uniref:Family 43 glycosylhydrolase n=1 Tax=Roseihalotalea indica TaxID=2867963 RepID=A0AA49GGY8_9BACT|nr:family 43 glycosylhydrolase [Tunicatimonas sp. TK19036]
MLCSTFKSYSQQLPSIDNPVLPNVADAGVIRFNGEYYIGGVFTNGGFYRSADLVHWEGPIHVFSMNNEWTDGPSADDSQIHASDIQYINGLFHHYWSVNYWGKEQHAVHIGHATSSNVLGPYEEPVKDTWLDNRIDPHLFVDDDGQLYMYMVKFTDGNTIWVRPMQDPQTFSGEPRYVFSSWLNTWETLDSRVEEGPWVIKYRSTYYLMYNANHTSTRWGNYALGVAQADSPLEFNHGNKYPYPVVKSNQIELEETYADLLKYADEEPGVVQYSFEEPKQGWNTPEFNASGWQQGSLGFGSDVVENSTTRQVKNLWETSDIWVRKSFTLNSDSTGNLMLRMHHDGDTEVYLNGKPIYEQPDRQYTNWNFDQQANALLENGENTLAIHSTQGRRGSFLDVSLFDMKGQVGEDIMYSPGQPNILRGPNGFEWWLIYMANKNTDRRSQYINRVHFYDKRMVVDGITGSKTPGYHPEPAQPTFSGLFNDADARQWQSNWEISGGDWELRDAELVQTSDQTSQALIKSQPATHYLFEAGVKLSGAGTSRAGIYAYWQDENNWLKILLNPEQKSWSFEQMVNGESENSAFSLPTDFNYEVYHTLHIEKNAKQFTVKIDGLPAPEHPLISLESFSAPGLPGLYSEGASAFDGVVYTIGWDEFDQTITGWGAASRRTPQQGSWEVGEEGLTQSGTSGESTVFKGDLLEEYEFSVQLTTESDQGSAGIYPVYTDANNYVKATLDVENQKFTISGKKDGKALTDEEISLAQTQTYYADMKYTDFMEKRFTLHDPAYISRLRFNKTPHNQPDTLIEDIYEKMNIFYRQQGQWHPLSSYQEVSSSHPGFDEIAFEAVKADALRFVNKGAEDRQTYLYKIGVRENFKHSYNLSVAKRKDTIIFLVDGKVVYQMKNNFPASQVGLFTDQASARFNGITLFQL